MALNIGSLVNALTEVGVTPANISSIVKSALGSSIASKVDPLLEQLVVTASSPDAVKAIVSQIETTPGLPGSVVPVLEGLKAPGLTPVQVMQAVQAIETELKNA